MTSSRRRSSKISPNYPPGGPYAEGGPMTESHLDPVAAANDLKAYGAGIAHFMESYGRDDSQHLRQQAEELRHKADLLLKRNHQLLDSHVQQVPSGYVKTKSVCNNDVNTYLNINHNAAAAATTTTASTASMPLSPKSNDGGSNTHISSHAATAINSIDEVHARMERIRKNRAAATDGDGNGLFQKFSDYGKGFFDKIRQSHAQSDTKGTEAAPPPLHTQTTLKSKNGTTNGRPRRQSSNGVGTLMEFTDKAQKKKRRRQRSRSRQRRNRITRE